MMDKKKEKLEIKSAAQVVTSHVIESKVSQNDAPKPSQVSQEAFKKEEKEEEPSTNRTEPPRIKKIKKPQH